MDYQTETPTPYGPNDSEETLRGIYGAEAIFSRVGRFTLVHLDAPTPEEIAKREAEFSPEQFFFDDCPLCASAKEAGGHIVFDNYDGSEWEEDDDTKETGTRRISLLLDSALNALTREAQAFGNGLGPQFPPQLAERYFEDVEMLNERFVDALGEGESEHRVEAFDRQLGRAARTLGEIVVAEPALAARAKPVEDALARLAAVWRDV